MYVCGNLSNVTIRYYMIEPLTCSWGTRTCCISQTCHDGIHLWLENQSEVSINSLDFNNKLYRYLSLLVSSTWSSHSLVVEVNEVVEVVMMGSIPGSKGGDCNINSYNFLACTVSTQWENIGSKVNIQKMLDLNNRLYIRCLTRITGCVLQYQ